MLRAPPLRVPAAIQGDPICLGARTEATVVAGEVFNASMAGLLSLDQLHEAVAPAADALVEGDVLPGGFVEGDDREVPDEHDAASRTNPAADAIAIALARRLRAGNFGTRIRTCVQPLLGWRVSGCSGEFRRRRHPFSKTATSGARSARLLPRRGSPVPQL